MDVENSFNPGHWTSIKRLHIRMNTLRYLSSTLASYFIDRQVEYDTEEGTSYYCVSAEFPQGSVLGPPLWNIMYNVPKSTKI